MGIVNNDIIIGFSLISHQVSRSWYESSVINAASKFKESSHFLVHQCEYSLPNSCTACHCKAWENTPACTQTNSIFGPETACKAISEHLNDKIFQERGKGGIPTDPPSSCVLMHAMHTYHTRTSKLKSPFQNPRSTICEPVKAKICNFSGSLWSPLHVHPFEYQLDQVYHGLMFNLTWAPLHLQSYDAQH